MKNSVSFVIKAILAIAIFTLSWTFSKAQKATQLTHSVYFATDKFDLNNNARKQLDSFVRRLKSSVDYNVFVEANTDADGMDDYNDVLSKNRAAAVARYLSEKGIVISKIKTKANGEQKPLFTNETDEGKAGNRRVDLQTTLYRYENLNEILQSSALKTEQHFSLRNDKATTIKAANGSQITIPANSLTFADGTKPTGNVELIVKEALSPSDILLSNLSTTSNGKLLETGGMIYVEARANGQKLNVAKGQNIDVAIPTQQQKPGMQLFYGQKTSDGKLNWVAANQTPKKPKVKIDKTKLPKLNFLQNQLPKPPSYAYVPKQPAKPTAPYKPYEVKAPDHLKYSPSFVENILDLQKRIERKEEQLNEPKQKVYEQMRNAYETNKAKYDSRLAAYKQQKLPAYNVSYASYDSVLTSRADEINEYLMKLMHYAAERNLRRQINATVNSSIFPETRMRLGQMNWSAEPLCKEINIYDFVAALVGVNNIDFAKTKKSAYYDYPSNIEMRNIASRIIYLKNGAIVFTDKNALYNEAYSAVVERSGVKNYGDAFNDLVVSTSLRSGILNSYEMTNYVYSLNQFSWINCDRFSNSTAPMVNVNISEPNTEAKIMVICNDLNSYLSANQYGNVWTSGNIPKDTKITIVGIKMVDGKLQMGILKGAAGEKATYALDYKDCSVNELRKQLQKLNS